MSSWFYPDWRTVLIESDQAPRPPAVSAAETSLKASTEQVRQDENSSVSVPLLGYSAGGLISSLYALDVSPNSPASS